MIQISLIIVLVSVLSIGATQVFATGCPANFVEEHVNNALKAFEDGDMNEVKNQLDLANEAVQMFSEEED